MIRIVATAIVVVVICAPVATSAPQAVKPIEARWIAGLTPLIRLMGDAGGEVARASQQADVFLSGSGTQVRLSLALAGFQSCSPSLRKAGQPPTLRLVRFRDLFAQACAAYGRSATQLATGIDRVDVDMVRAAAMSIRRGNAYMIRANAALDALR
jgi:hypothetical protein